MKPDGIETPVVPVLGASGQSRVRARIAGVALVAVALLAAGIGFAGNGFGLPTESPSTSTAASPSTSGAPSAGTQASPTPPAPSDSPLPPPTRNAVLACAPVRPGKPPDLRLTARQLSMVIRGAPAPTSPASAMKSPSGWPVLPLDGALRAGLSGLDLSALEDGCMRYVVAEFAPATAGASPAVVPFPVALRTLNVSPPLSVVPLGAAPEGDWIVRVVAYFSSGQVGQEDASVVERFFRVITTDSPGPIPTPAIPAAVACGLPRTEGIPPGLVLTGSSEGPVDGVVALEPAHITPVRLGDKIEVRVDGDVCALAWTIHATGQDRGFELDQDTELNPTNNPFLFTQNRWLLHDLSTGQLSLTATVRFSADLSTTAHWLLDVQGGDVPVVRVTTPTGTAVVGARAPCYTQWNSSGATSGAESCTRETLPSPIPTLVAPPESVIRVDVPGWTIVAWGGSCGRGDPTSPDVPYTVTNGCDLGNWFSPDGSSGAKTVRFLTRADAALYRVFVTAIRGNKSVTVTIYVTVNFGR